MLSVIIQIAHRNESVKIFQSGFVLDQNDLMVSRELERIGVYRHLSVERFEILNIVFFHLLDHTEIYMGEYLGISLSIQPIRQRKHWP